MGTNRRYATQLDRKMDDRIVDQVAGSGPLQTLSKTELQLDRLPVTTDPQPKRVKAWVRFGPVPVQVDADACMWTTNAIAIRFHALGREHRCWVWAGAVDSDRSS